MGISLTMFSERHIINTTGLLSLQNTEEEANLPLPLDIQTLKSFHLQRVKPLDPVEGFFPNPRYRLVFAMSPHYPGVLKTNR